MLTVNFNPMQIIIDVCNQMFPDLSAIDISMISSDEMAEIAKLEREKEKVDFINNNEVKEDEEIFFAGVTMFDDDKNPAILINGAVPLEHVVEVVAHEVAHVVAGVEAEHGKEFEKVFNDIFQAYCIAHERIKKDLTEVI